MAMWYFVALLLALIFGKSYRIINMDIICNVVLFLVIKDFFIPSFVNNSRHDYTTFSY